jgi:hypothetical protein
VYSPSSTGRRKAQIDSFQGSEPFYEQACNDAWAYFWANQTIFNEDGTITATALSNSVVKPIVDGSKLVNDADLWAVLSAIDPDPSNWVKGTTTSSFSDPYPFQVHFYWHLSTNTAWFDIDFKIRFNNIFEP